MQQDQKQLILVGYWRGGDDPANDIYPSPVDFVDESWNVDELEQHERNASWWLRQKGQ